MDAISCPLRFKGVVKIQVVDKDGLITQEHIQENVWFNQGFKNILDGRSVYTIISSNTVAFTEQSISIPSVLTNTTPTRVYTAVDMSHLFTASFSPPGSPRTVNSIGLAGATDGTLGWCGMVLTVPIVQGITDTLYVYYTIFIQYPTVGAGQGVTRGAVYTYIAPDIFTNFAAMGVVSNLVGIGQVDDSCNVNHWITGSPSPTTDLYYPVVNRTVDSSRYRAYGKITMGIITDLTRCAGVHLARVIGYLPAGTSSSQYARVMVPYNDWAIGRVWAKKDASTVEFFDSANLPNGYSKAVDARLPSGFTGIDIKKLQYNVDIQVGGAVGTGTYQLSTVVRELRNTLPGGISIEYPKGVFTRGGKDFVVFRTNVTLCNVDDDMMYNLFTTGFPDITWAAYDSVNDVLWAIQYTDRKQVGKFQLTTPLGDSTLPVIYSHATESFEIIQLISTTKAWLATGTKWFELDLTTGIFTEVFFNATNYGLLIPSSQNHAYCFDAANNRLLFRNGVDVVSIVSVIGADVNGITVPWLDDFADGSILGYPLLYRAATADTLTESGGLLTISTATSVEFDSTLSVRPNRLAHLFEAGSFEITCYISSFNPTTAYQQAGLFVQTLVEANTSGTGSHKRIVRRRSGSNDMSVFDNTAGGAKVTEQTVTSTLTAFRLKLTRDASDIIRCYYSTDPIGTPDVSATWTLLGNQTFTLAGRVYAGICGLAEGGTTRINAQVEEFRINSGTIDKKVVSLFLANDLTAVAQMQSYISRYLGPFTPMVKYGSNYYVCGTNGRIVSIDTTTLAATLLPRTFESGSNACIHGYTGVGILYRYSGSQPWLLMDGGADWYQQTFGTTSSPYVLVKNRLFYLSTGSTYCQALRAVWGWNGSAWVFGSTTPRTSHTTWENLPFGGQLRFVNNPANPALTLNAGDKYDFYIAKGLIKDNQQIVSNLGLAFYFGSFVYVSNEAHIPGDYVVDGSHRKFDLAAKVIAGFMSCDFDMRERLFFKSSGVELYWTTKESGLSVTNVVSTYTSFKDTVSVISAVYNKYKDMYVRFTTGANIGLRRKITEYDGYYDTFVTQAFPNAVVVTDQFVIEIPTQATKASASQYVGMYEADIIPDMTSDSAPAPYATAASSLYSTQYAYRAFDVNTLTPWSSNTSDVVGAWISADLGFGYSKVVVGVSIRGVEDLLGVGCSVQNFKVQGSNDGSVYTDISGTLTAAQLSSTTQQDFFFDNAIAYRFHRIYVLSNYGATRVGFADIIFRERNDNSYYPYESVGELRIPVWRASDDTDISYGYVKRA